MNPLIREVRTWKDLRSGTTRGAWVQIHAGSRALLASPTVTASRWRACQAAGSEFATARTPQERCSSSHPANGTHSSAECETENSTVSVKSDFYPTSV